MDDVPWPVGADPGNAEFPRVRAEVRQGYLSRHTPTLNMRRDVKIRVRRCVVPPVGAAVRGEWDAE